MLLLVACLVLVRMVGAVGFCVYHRCTLGRQGMLLPYDRGCPLFEDAARQPDSFREAIASAKVQPSRADTARQSLLGRFNFVSRFPTHRTHTSYSYGHHESEDTDIRGRVWNADKRFEKGPKKYVRQGLHTEVEPDLVEVRYFGAEHECMYKLYVYIYTEVCHNNWRWRIDSHTAQHNCHMPAVRVKQIAQVGSSRGL